MEPTQNFRELLDAMKNQALEIAVTDLDVACLKATSKSLGPGRIRLLWSPAPTRANPNVVPTHVRLLASEPTDGVYALAELDRDRQARHALDQRLKAA